MQSPIGLVSLTVIAAPLVLLVWAIVGAIVYWRAELAPRLLGILGALLTSALVVTYLGAVEIGLCWVFSAQGVAATLTGAGGLALFVWAEIAKRRAHRVPLWACPACGYDLRGLAGACPECGAHIIPVPPRTPPDAK